MRKYFLSFVALAAGLFATSCQESIVEPQIAGPTTFTVQLPDQMGTKAIGDAENVNKLLVEVYPAGQENSIYQTVKTISQGKTTIELSLIQDQAYDILFWAQKDNGYVSVATDGTFYSLRDVPMNNNFSNDDNGAAFFHAEKGFVPSGTSKEVKLRRPFAQLNLGTTAKSLETNAGNFELVSSQITIIGVATSFNVFTGEGIGNADVKYVYESANVPTEDLIIGTAPNTTTYDYVSMNYLSVLGNEKDLVNVDATIVVKKGAEQQTITHTFTSVPVQENYRTNIVGNLISSTTDFNITIEEGFVDANGNSNPDNNYTIVSTYDELVEAVKIGGIIKFANDITVDKWNMFSETMSIGSGAIITVGKIDVTINGNGHTLTINSIESAGNGNRLFYDASILNISDLTIKYADGLNGGGIGMTSGLIKNVNFVGGGYGILPGDGEITVESCIFNTNADGLYFEQERDNLTVTGCTFNQPAEKNVILLRGDVKFTSNTINSGRTVNIVSGSPLVDGNNFNDVRLKVYEAATAIISNNIIGNLVFESVNGNHNSTFINNTITVKVPENNTEDIVLNSGNIEVTIPASVTSEGDEYRIEVSNENTTTNTAGETNVSFDLTLYKNGTAVNGGTTTYEVALNIGVGKIISSVTHNGTDLNQADTKADQTYNYDSATGVLTIYTNSFSPFEIIYSNPIAKVGNTEYGSIDDAIAAWTNNTTLTLLADVTLSDVVTLNSTEHHILDLSTFTMTAASGKNAFVIKACGTGDAERTAITIKADETNPGGINAGSKSIIYYKYADGGITVNDRPIINIIGGIFTGSTSSWGTAGIYVIGSAARKAATIKISGGVFNCSINGSTKSKLLISGGVFHYSVGSQGDQTAYRLISGGKFKSFGFMTADTNNTKFWIGTEMAKSDVGVYVDDEGYFVIGGPVITQFENKFEAMINAEDVSQASHLLKYSSAATYGLYYTKAQVAIDKFENKPSVEVVIK